MHCVLESVCIVVVYGLIGPGQIHNDDLFSVFSADISVSAHVLASICYSLSTISSLYDFVYHVRSSTVCLNH